MVLMEKDEYWFNDNQETVRKIFLKGKKIADFDLPDGWILSSARVTRDDNAEICKMGISLEKKED